MSSKDTALCLCALLSPTCDMLQLVAFKIKAISLRMDAEDADKKKMVFSLSAFLRVIRG